MKVLMFSMERALLGEKTLGDAVERHRRYAEVRLDPSETKEVSRGKQIEELNIVVFAKRGYQKEQLSDKVFVYPTDSKTRFGFFWDAYKIGKQIYQDSPYDLVIGDFLTGFSAWLLKRKFKIKFLMHFHGDFWGNRKAMEGKWHNWFLLILSKFLARRADGIRVVSGGIKKSLVKKGIKKKKIAVINTPTSIHLLDNPELDKVEELKRRYGEKKVVLFIGRLEKVKNLDWFIRVFREVRDELRIKNQEVSNKNVKKIEASIVEDGLGQNDCTLVMIGDGSERNNLEGLVEELDLKGDVFFEGKVGVDKWKNYFQVADMLVLPSLSESFGNVAALAGAAGLPVVASQTTGVRDIVKDKETGFLVPIDNQKKFRSAILDLLEDEGKAKRMGLEAYKYCRDKFDPEKTSRKIVEFWWEIVEKKQ